MKTDPHEWTDLAEDPEHAATKTRLLGALRQWQVNSNDPLRDPEKLRTLIEENDAVFKAGKRSPAGGWKYLQYLHPGRMTDAE